MTEEEQIEAEMPDCQHEAPPAPHPCPYMEEIHGDSRPCTCCEDCVYQCAQDI